MSEVDKAKVQRRLLEIKERILYSFLFSAAAGRTNNERCAEEIMIVVSNEKLYTLKLSEMKWRLCQTQFQL